MKKMMVFVTAAVLVFGFTNLSSAKEEKQKGASDKAYEQASDKAIFNRVGDWFATIGKDKEEKARIKSERQAARALKKAEKAAKKEKKRQETEMTERGRNTEQKAKDDAKGKMKREEKELKKRVRESDEQADEMKTMKGEMMEGGSMGQMKGKGRNK